MDLIKTFLETAFCKYEYRRPALDTLMEIRGKDPDEQLLMIDCESFVNMARAEHPELSDDNLRLIYSMFRDRWSRVDDRGRRNIFHSLRSFADETVTMCNGVPRVSFNNLFRWYELSQVVGEDLIVCAFLAGKELFADKPRIDFGWPRILRTSNVELNDCFDREGLAELHQHLKASTCVFGISWACLMNHVTLRRHDFSMVYDDDPRLAQRMYERYVEAAAIRLQLWRSVNGEKMELKKIDDACFNMQLGNLSELQSDINIASTHPSGGWRPDYAWGTMTEDTEIFAGERKLLYMVFRRIFLTGDIKLTALLHHYVLTKAGIRERMVQINRNTGFANFNRYETRKEIFLYEYPKYSELLKSVPVYEAMKKHDVRYVETRIVPGAPYHKLKRELHRTERLICRNIAADTSDDCRIIYHFIKKRDAFPYSESLPRNHRVRMEVRHKAVALHGLFENQRHRRAVGIDAANSEMFCRPEVFAHAYRYLDLCGVRRTFHVGEDYFDLTDGLRAMDEAVFFLGMRHGDRLGHGIALGINSQMYYEARHFHVPVPLQVLLDNLVWMYFTSKKFNVTLPPKVEIMILERFRTYARMYGRPSIEDYYYSMLLRGNSPYHDSYMPYAQIIRDWDSMAHDDRRVVRENWEIPHIRRLFMKYHFDTDVKREGGKVVDFEVPREYPGVMALMQDRMMEKIAKRNIAVECCPTSNVRIGSLGRYDNHPVFRLMPPCGDGLVRPVATVNTDDIGIFSTSLDNEYALLALALLKKRDGDGRHIYDSRQVMRWIESLLRNGNAFRFI